jgi:TetR/AcrR family transcriptional regulator, fatty acid metabolism regulator protein
MVGLKKSETRKAQILKAAERIFAQSGFNEATISDVAREAKVSDATIYEYFASKEDLLFSIPLETTIKGNEILDFHLNYVRGAANKIRSIIYHYLAFYQMHPDYASVIMLTLKTNRKYLETEGYQAFREGARVMLRVIGEGIAQGEFKPDTDPYLVRSVILGTIEHLVIRKTLLGRDENLTAVVDQLTDLIIDGIRTDPVSQSLKLRVIMDSSEDMSKGRNVRHE